jgi:NADH-ubiquinone oxidoreductase chain 5
LSFINKSNSYKQLALLAHEPRACISIPLVVLAIGSLFVGYLSKDMIVGLGSAF